MPKSKHTLTPKQGQFVLEYLIDLNATQAAIRAGYSARTADKAGPALLGKTRIAEAIQAAMSERAQKTRTDAAFVLERLREAADADIADILDSVTGAYKPIQEWPLVWRRMIRGLDVRELFEPGADGLRTGEIIKAKFAEYLKTLELLGRHVGVGAFVERHEHAGPGGGPIRLVVEYADDGQ